MSSFSPVELTVIAEDRAAELSVLDWQFRLAASGAGEMTAKLAPGIYKVRARAGSAEFEDFAVLEREHVTLRVPPLTFTSSAPLAGTAKTHEYQRDSAHEFSKQVQVNCGQGSWFYLYAREWTAHGQPLPLANATLHPAAGLRLLDAQGNEVVNFEQAAHRGDALDPWAACNVELNPGTYVLELQFSGTGQSSGQTGPWLPAHSLKQSVIASPGWQTQGFLLQRDYEGIGRRADLAQGAFFMSQGMEFQPGDHQARLTELARLSLAAGKLTLSTEQMNGLLSGKHENPLLGIYAGHLLLLHLSQSRLTEPTDASQSRSWSMNDLRAVVGNLRRLLRDPHPDVEALALAAGMDLQLAVFQTPPLLRRSWDIICRATTSRPELVPLGSAAEQAGRKIWGTSQLLIWLESGADPQTESVNLRRNISANLLFHQARSAPVERLPMAAENVGALEPIARGTDSAIAAAAAGDVTRLVGVFGVPRSTIESISLSDEEVSGLEAIVRASARPMLLVQKGSYGPIVSESWSRLNDDSIRGRLQSIFPSIGWVALPAPAGESDSGTAFVVGPSLLMTTRSVASRLAEGIGTRVKFRGAAAFVEFGREAGSLPPHSSSRITGVVLIHPDWDLALLRVDGLPSAALPLRISAVPPEGLLAQRVVSVGHPVLDAREPIELQRRTFHDQFGVKRAFPGRIQRRERTKWLDKELNAMTDDCSTLGSNPGAPLIHLATGTVVGMQFVSEYLYANFNVPMSDLAQDPLLIDAGVNFEPQPESSSQKTSRRRRSPKAGRRAAPEAAPPMASWELASSESVPAAPDRSSFPAPQPAPPSMSASAPTLAETTLSFEFQLPVAWTLTPAARPASERSRQHSLSALSRPVADFGLVSRWLRAAQPGQSESATAAASSSSLEAIHAAAASVASPQQRGEFIAQTVVALRELQDAFQDVDAGVLQSPRNRLAALLQTELEKRAAAAASLEFPFDKQDVRDVLRDVFDRLAQTPRHAIARPVSAVPDLFSDRGRIFVVGDFGTGMYGALQTARTVLSGDSFDLLLHLGDIYYSGETDEVQSRFLDVWPRAAGALSRTLNGNHDMYSGGYGYFDRALASFSQPSSYFALQNSHWLLLCLDTAWLDNDLDDEQVAWIGQMVAQAGARRVVLFSHHPLFSNFKDQGVRLWTRLHELLQARRVFAWYWGHEHHCVLYDRHPIYGLHARCLGHGGMPYLRKDLNDWPVESEVAGAAWRRIASELTPSGLVLDGPNPYIPGHEDKYGPHGYATLQLDGPHLVEAVFSPSGECLYSRELA